jgi:hypothetical protein
MELQRIGIKVFCRDGGDIPFVDFIPVFHRWIQQGVTDTLLLDVADYSHVVDGPGILLAALEGNFAVDETGGRRGLAYYQKMDQEGDLDARLTAICARVLAACGRLESEPEFEGKLSFDAADLELFSNDRLHGPNTPASNDAFEPHVRSLLARMYGDEASNIERESDPRERLSFAVRNDSADAGVASALAKLGG